MKKSNIKKILILMMIFIFSISLVSRALAYSETEEIEENLVGATSTAEKIHFFRHTGDGNADTILIETNGLFGLVDAGTATGAADVKTYLTKALNGKKLDFIIITHSHADHVGGFPVLAEFADSHTIVFYKEYKYIINEEDFGKWNNIGYMNKALKSLTTNGAVLCNVEKPNISNVKKANSNITGMVFNEGSNTTTNVDDNLYFKIGDYEFKLFNVYHISDDEDNTNSIVTYMKKGTQKIVLMGDQETRIRPLTGNKTQGVENQIADIIGKVSLIKAGHHGNKSSNSLYLLEKMKPKYMVITCNWGSSNEVRSEIRFATRYIGSYGGEVYVAGKAPGCVVCTVGDDKMTFADYDFNQKKIENSENITTHHPTGWQAINGTSTDDRIWNYIKSDGTLAEGWTSIGGRWYYFCTEDNEFTGYRKYQMLKGWKHVKYKGKLYWFYFIEDETKYDVVDSEGNVTTDYKEGQMLTGRKQVVYNGKSYYYYFCETTGNPVDFVKGAMVKNATIGKYSYGSSGADEEGDKVKPVATVKYSSTTPTNKGVLVKITANEEITISDKSWTRSYNKRELTKIYTSNTNGEITLDITDLAGNSCTKPVKIKISNIDTTVPNGQATKSITAPTKNSVKVTITASEQIKAVSGWTLSDDKKSLSKTYTDNTNGNVTVTITDLAGNTSTVTFSVTNIDKTLPKADVTYTPNTATNKDVVVKIIANEKIKPVSGWTLSSDSKTLSRTYTQNTNGDVSVTITDLAGNSITEKINVNKIDKEGPKGQRTMTPSTPTNGSVVVRFVFDEAIQYTQDMQDKGWIKINTKTIEKTYTSNTNGEVSRKVYDLVGNEGTIKVNISNIDKTVPEAGVSYNPSGATTGNVKVTITANEKIKEVSGWTLSSDEKTLTKTYTDNTNGDVNVKIVDLAGNSITKKINVSNIQRGGPSIKSVTYNPEGPTKGNVTVTITTNDEIQEVSGWTLSSNKKVLTKVFSENTNGEKTVTLKNLLGTERKVTYNVDNIDKTAPGFSRTITPEEPTNGSVVARFEFNEEIQFTQDMQNNGWRKINDTIIEKTYEENTNGTLSRKVKDLVGNETTISVNINNIDKTDPTMEIVKTPSGLTNGNVTVTINASEKIQEVSGWTLSSDGKKLTKVFTGNTNGEVEITINDLAGNTATKTFVIDNIDKDIPILNPVKYSKTEPTNEDVIATIEANEEIQLTAEMENGGWRKTNSTTLEKTYTANTKEGGESFTIKDLAGNKRSIVVEIYNIDKVKPTVSNIEYSPNGPTKEDVTITISFTERVNPVDGWGLSDDGTTITRTFTENTDGDVTIYYSDPAGNTNSQIININNIDRADPVLEEISYSEENLTNKDVVVIIRFNEEVQLSSEIESNGWQRVNANTLKKIYTENTPEGGEEVSILDLASNGIEVTIEINNIDKVAPKVQISYSTEEETTNPVIVTIQADETIKDISGWKRVDDNTLKRTYYENTNGNVSVVVSDMAGNKISKSYKVSNIVRAEPLITSETYNIANMQISKVKPNTKVDTFLNNITIKNVDNIKVYDSNDNELSMSSNITTGSVLVLNDEIEFLVVVKGDLNGDGLVTVKDLAKEQRKILNQNEELTDIQFIAGDTDDSGAISIKDLASVQRYILTGKGL